MLFPGIVSISHLPNPWRINVYSVGETACEMKKYMKKYTTIAGALTIHALL
jgi:hypothetical protein